MFTRFSHWLIQVQMRFRNWRDGRRSSKKGWRAEQTEDGTIYTGVFVVWDYETLRKTRISGCIVEQVGNPTAVYLHEPPSRVWNHPHGRCLQLIKPGSLWFKLHWMKPAYHFDTARDYVEALLTEALRSQSSKAHER